MTDYYTASERTYLSLGAGVQSTALLILCGEGRIPKPRYAFFADTGDEPEYVYQHLAWCIEYARGKGIDARILAPKRGKLSDNAFTPGKFTPIPAYSVSRSGHVESRGRRQCTREYKLEPLYRVGVRQIMWGLKSRQRRCDRTATALVGISVDEASRAKPSRYPGVTNKWPLLDMGASRSDCRRIVEKFVPHQVSRSACVYCPFKNDRDWLAMREEHPREFERACEYDDRLRLVDTDQPFFVHVSCRPLRDVELAEDRQAEFFDNECEGICGV